MCYVIPEDHNLNIHCHGNLKSHIGTPLVKMADKGYTAEHEFEAMVGTWRLSTSKIVCYNKCFEQYSMKSASISDQGIYL
jgi:hypothetical protein